MRQQLPRDAIGAWDLPLKPFWTAVTVSGEEIRRQELFVVEIGRVRRRRILARRKRVDERRWLDVSFARSAYESATEAIDSWPIEAFFEVAARCNLRCQMCAINYDSRYQPRSGRPPFFEPDLFARLRPIFPSLLRAYLFGL